MAKRALRLGFKSWLRLPAGRPDCCFLICKRSTCQPPHWAAGRLWGHISYNSKYRDETQILIQKSLSEQDRRPYKSLCCRCPPLLLSPAPSLGPFSLSWSPSRRLFKPLHSEVISFPSLYEGLLRAGRGGEMRAGRRVMFVSKRSLFYHKFAIILNSFGWRIFLLSVTL